MKRLTPHLLLTKLIEYSESIYGLMPKTEHPIYGDIAELLDRISFDDYGNRMRYMKSVDFYKRVTVMSRLEEAVLLERLRNDNNLLGKEKDKWVKIVNNVKEDIENTYSIKITIHNDEPLKSICVLLMRACEAQNPDITPVKQKINTGTNLNQLFNNLSNWKLSRETVIESFSDLDLTDITMPINGIFFFGEDKATTFERCKISRKTLLGEGHTTRVRSVQFSPDSQKLVTASWDSTVKEWNLNGECLCTYAKHTREVNTAFYSADGRNILSAGRDGNIFLWTVGKPDEYKILRHPAMANSAQFHPNPAVRRCVSAGSNCKAIEHDLDTGEPIFYYPHTAVVNFAEYSPKGDRILTVSDDNKVYIWEVGNTEKPLRLIRLKNISVRIACHPKDNERFLCADADNLIEYGQDDSPLNVYKGVSSMINWMTYSKSGERIFTASNDGQICEWLPNSPKPFRTYRSEFLSSFNDCVCFANTLIASSGEDGCITLYSTESRYQKTFGGFSNTVLAAAVNDAKTKLIIALRDNTIRIIDLKKNLTTQVIKFDFSNVRLANFYMNSEEMSLYVLAHDSRFLRYKLSTSDSRKELAHEKIIDDAAPNLFFNLLINDEDSNSLTYIKKDFSVVIERRAGVSEIYTGNPLITLYMIFNRDKTLFSQAFWDGTIWEINTISKESRVITKLDKAISCLSYSDDNERILVGAYDTLVEINRETGGIQQTGYIKHKKTEAHRCCIKYVEYLNDGRILSVGEDGQVKLWEMINGVFELKYEMCNYPLYLLGCHFINCEYDCDETICIVKQHGGIIKDDANK